MRSSTDFIKLLSGPGNSGDRDPKYATDSMAIKQELLEFKHVIKGSLPGDIVAGEALAESIKTADVIVYSYEVRLGTIFQLEALKVNYRPPQTPVEIATEIARLGRPAPRPFTYIKTPAMLNELNQFISEYKSKFPEPANYDNIKSKLIADRARLKVLINKMRASWSGGGASAPASTAAPAAAVTTQLAKPSLRKPIKNKPIPKPKGRR
jgi:hypothetical protein